MVEDLVLVHSPAKLTGFAETTEVIYLRKKKSLQKKS